MSQPDEKDTAREVRPVVMFDSDKEGKQHPEFPPVSNYVERIREQEKFFAKNDKAETDTPESDERPPDHSDDVTGYGASDEDEPEAPEYEETGGLATAEPEQGGDALPPEPSPEPVEKDEPEEDEPSAGDSNENVDDIPSPWDAPTSD